MATQTMPELISRATSISSTSEFFNSDSNLTKQVMNDRINQVFGAVRAAFPAHFESLYGDSSKYDGERGQKDKENKRQSRITAKRLWMITPEFQRLRPDQVERAIRGMQLKCRFVPSLAEFLDLAADRPEDFGLPASDDAWIEANNRRQSVMERAKVYWTHPAIALAGRGLWHRMGMADEIGMKQIKAEFDRAYQREAARVISGNDASSDLMQLEDHSSYADKQLIQSKIEIDEQMEKQGITPDAAAARARLKGLF